MGLWQSASKNSNSATDEADEKLLERNGIEGGAEDETAVKNLRRVDFSDKHGRACCIKLKSNMQLDLSVDGRQAVENLHSLHAFDDTLHFDGKHEAYQANSIQIAGSAPELEMRIWAMKGARSESIALKLLCDSTVRILSALWLLHRSSDFVLQRCQDLPADAFLPPLMAGEVFQQPHRLVILSYPWLTKQHPDPTGFYFRTLQKYLAKHASYIGDEGMSDFGVFWDFAALPQRCPKGELTASEKYNFKRGISCINYLYGCKRTVKLLLRQLPEDSGEGLNLRPYDQRGWCLFEATIAELLSPPRRILDLGLEAAREALNREDSNWSDVQAAAAAQRKPPVHPDILKAELAKTTFTKGNVDRILVEEKYREFFFQTVPFSTMISLRNASQGRGWDDSSAHVLSGALPCYTRLQTLSLAQHSFSDDGLYMILAQLPKLQDLYDLSFAGCTSITGAGFSALAGHSMPAMRSLSLRRSALDDVGLSSLAQHLTCFPNLRQLRLSDCMRISHLGIRLFAANLPLCLEELYLGGSPIDDRGLRALAEGLPGLQQLRMLDFRGCHSIGLCGLSALTSCLPQLPGMAKFEESARCCDGHDLEASRLPLDPPAVHPCCRCAVALQPGTACYSCDECRRRQDVLRRVFCTVCRYGSLWLPVNLQGTPQAEELLKVWAADGREERQVQWC